MSFARLGELRSLIPVSVNIIALTATATWDTLKVVQSRLSMPNPVVIGLPPHRGNIFYSVQPYVEIFELGAYLMNHIIQHYPNVPKIVVFCPTLNSGSQLNKLLHSKLRQHYGGNLDLVDMFNKACSI